MKKIIILATVIFLFLNIKGFSQVGILDSDFDTDGIKNIDSDYNSEAKSMLVQPDGKILIGGYTTISGNLFTLIRLHPDGSFDNSFGTNGIVTTSIAFNSSQAESMALQADGKILLGGYSNDGNYDNFALARYNTDGSLDDTFSYDGIVTTGFDTDNSNVAEIVIQNDGKIIAAGTAIVNTQLCFALVRYNNDGSLDLSFDGDGKVITNYFTTWSTITAAKIQANGKIVVAGYILEGSYNKFAVARYNVDGSIDNTFGSSGITITSIGDSRSEASSLDIQDDGKIVVAGTYFDQNSSSFALARYNPDGNLDLSFGNDGKVITPIGGSFDFAYAVTLQPDNKIIVAGCGIEHSNNDWDIALVRYNIDGSIDDSFGANGKVITQLGSVYDIAYDIVMQSNGRILVAGSIFLASENNYNIVAVRYLSGLNIGILDFQENNILSIYPNPIKDNATLEFSLNNEETISIDLYDMHGKLVQQFVSGQNKQSGNYKEQLHFSNSLPSGNYILKISNGKGSQNIKVVVDK